MYIIRGMFRFGARGEKYYECKLTQNVSVY